MGGPIFNMEGVEKRSEENNAKTESKYYQQAERKFLKRHKVGTA